MPSFVTRSSSWQLLFSNSKVSCSPAKPAPELYLRVQMEAYPSTLQQTNSMSL